MLFLEIKICGTPQDDCSEFATCADTGLGTYACTCNEGYTGDGKTCEGNLYTQEMNVNAFPKRQKMQSLSSISVNIVEFSSQCNCSIFI